MRIAIYSGSIPSTTFIEHLIRGVADAGHTVLVFGMEKGTVQYENSCVIQIPTPRNFIKMCFWTFWLRLKLRFKSNENYQVLRETIDEHSPKSWRSRTRMWGRYVPVAMNKPDLFHLQWVKGVEDWLFLQKIGVKVVASLRGTHVNTSPVANLSLANSYLKAFPKVDRFHAVSNAIAAKAAKYGAPLDRVDVIRPAVNRDIMKPSLASLKSMDDRPLKLLSVGRDHWKKGYRYSLDACAELLRQGIDFEYTIVVGRDCEALRHQSNQLNLDERVHLVESLPHPKVLEMYRDADLFLLPSLEEGIANVVLEAMALGCPVLSSDCGGMKEVIKNRKNGLLFPVTDTGVLVGQMKHFLDMSAQETENMRLKARETIVQNHLLDQQIVDMIALYERVVGNTATSGI